MDKLLWTTGIKVKYGYAGNDKYGWSAECKWQSGNLGESRSVDGVIYTRYFEPTITEAVNYVLGYVKLFGIKLSNEIECMKDNLEFTLYRDEEEEYSGGILQEIIVEAKSRGWKTLF